MIRALVATIATAVVVFGPLASAPASAEPLSPEPPSAGAAPSGAVDAPQTAAPETPTSAPVEVASIESWTPSSHSVTVQGETTLDLFPQPVFKRDVEGWKPIESTITTGSGDYPFEALGLANPLHFGVTPEALVTLDTAEGPVAFGLEGANVNQPTLADGVVTYRDVFPGVDLEFRTDDGRLGKQLVLADADVQQAFRFTIADPAHILGDPVRDEDESWSFSAQVAFATGISFPAPSAWPQSAKGPGVPGSAHQEVSVTTDGYAVDLSVDASWVTTTSYPVVLDPAVEWTDETWTDDYGVSVAFAPKSATYCGGGPCQLADPVFGVVKFGTPDFYWPNRWNPQDPSVYYLTYVGADLSALSGRQVVSAHVVGMANPYNNYSVGVPNVQQVCSRIGTGNTGADLDAARCGEVIQGVNDATYPDWGFDVTRAIRTLVRGSGPTGPNAGFVLDIGDHYRHACEVYQVDQNCVEANPYQPILPHTGGAQIASPGLRLVYEGYPVPRPLTAGQTFGCDCWAGSSTGNQALAGDPVNTATGALVEKFADLSVVGVGQPLNLSRTYNSLDTSSGPFGPGWSFSYGASLTEDEPGVFVFRDGSGTQTRFGALVGGGYAPIDAAVSATLADGSDGTRVIRNLAGDTMTFDAGGVLIAAADERGQGLTMQYTNGDLATITDALGQQLMFEWDAGVGADARVVSATTSDGRSVGYTYAQTAGAKRLTVVTAVDGTATKFAYARTGGISSITDALGNVSARNTYNAAGRIVSQRDETGALTTFDWDATTQVATITDPTGKVRKDVYSNLNLVKQIDGNGVVIEQLYDGDNNPAATVDAADQLFRSEYDDRDRLVRRIAPSPLHYVESWTYDDADRVTSYTDADGFTTSYTYNAAGLVTAVVSPDGGTSTYTYTTGLDGSPANLLATSTDALGRTSSFTYDSAGDMVSTTTPGGHTSTSTYDDAHRLTSTTSPTGAVFRFTYDAAGRLLTTTDPAGATTRNTYDAGGRLTRTTNALGGSTVFKYDKADRLLSTRDAMGNTTSTAYDSAGRVTSTTDALGSVTTYAYDAAGRLTSTTDALGRTSSVEYDDLGQVTSTTDASGGVTTYAYDVLGQVTSVTDPDGVTQTTTYDRRGHVWNVANAAGFVSGTGYDSVGRLAYTTDGDGVYTWYEYDLAGQLLAQAKYRTAGEYVPDYWDDRTTYAYDVDGHLTSTVDPRGHVPGADPEDFTTTMTYDADGRPVTSTDPLGRKVTTTYDAAGRPVSVKDPAGNITTTTYNALGWTTSVTAPLVGRTRYTYDRVGNLTKRVDALSRATIYTYDAAGRLLTETDPLGRVTATTYDQVGNVTGVTKPSGTATPADPTDGTVSYSYDESSRPVAAMYSDDTAGFTYDYSPAGRLITAARVEGANVVASSAYEYDAAGRTTSVVRTGPGAGDANYSYTEAGRLSGVAWSTGAAVAYNYNSLGAISSVIPSGTVSLPSVAYRYDPAGRLTSTTRQGANAPVTSAVTYDNAGQVSSLVHSSGASVLEAYDITRDVQGNPVEVVTTSGGVASSALYSYDAVSRLKSECYPASGATCTSRSPRMLYTYDKVGNRATESARTVTGSTVATVQTAYSYDAAYQLVSESVGGSPTVTNTWTPNGELATSTTPAGTQTYTTDLSGELVSLVLADGSEVGYTHDVQGNRTSRTIDGVLDVEWAWDELGGLPVRVGEYGPSGALMTLWLPDPASSTGASLAETSGGASSWLLADPFANTVATVSTSGSTLSGANSLNAFGVPLAEATGQLADATTGFAGQYLDDATGLYDMRARDYDPASGRFTANDPVAIPTGMPYVAGYSYSYNNPLMFTDVTGNWPSGDDWYNAMADAVNGTASLGNAALQNPGAVLAVVGGAIAIAKGSNDIAAGSAVTVGSGGPGIVVGAPVAIAGVLEVAAGVTAVAVGGVMLVEESLGDCKVEVLERRGSGGGEPTSPGSQEPIGTHGTQTPGSKTLTDGVGSQNRAWRIDVENPAPGVRDGQMHLQGDFPGKIQFNFKTRSFEGMPGWLRDVAAKDPKFARGVRQGLKILGMGG